jgi:uncharacterized DUF497 family protein
MTWLQFIWDDDNTEHVAEHDVTQDEFEEVVLRPERVEVSKSTGRPIAFGFTSTGKFIAAVYDEIDEDTVYPVTAYEIGD